MNVRALSATRGLACVSLFPRSPLCGPAQGWVAMSLPGSWVSTLPAAFPKSQGLEPDRWAPTGAPKIGGYQGLSGRCWP